jgi:hypothetical protein
VPEQEAAVGGVDDWREYSARYVDIQRTTRRRCAVIEDPERTLCSSRRGGGGEGISDQRAMARTDHTADE